MRIGKQITEKHADTLPQALLAWADAKARAIELLRPGGHPAAPSSVLATTPTSSPAACASAS